MNHPVIMTTSDTKYQKILMRIVSHRSFMSHGMMLLNIVPFKARDCQQKLNGKLLVREDCNKGYILGVTN